MGTKTCNGAYKCQQLLTNQESLVGDLVLPSPLDEVVSRHSAAAARHKHRVDPLDGQTHTYGYNTSSKSNAKMLHKGVISKRSPIEWHQRK